MNSACARTLVRTIWVAWYVCTRTIIFCRSSPYSDMSSNLLFDLSGCQTSMSVQHTHYWLSPSVPPSLPSILALPLPPLTHPPSLPPYLPPSLSTSLPPSLPLPLHRVALLVWSPLSWWKICWPPNPTQPRSLVSTCILHRTHSTCLLYVHAYWSYSCTLCLKPLELWILNFTFLLFKNHSSMYIQCIHDMYIQRNTNFNKCTVTPTLISSSKFRSKTLFFFANFYDFSFYGKFNTKSVSRKRKRVFAAKYAFQMR